MAVYTPITLKDLSKFLSNYNLGKIIREQLKKVR